MANKSEFRISDAIISIVRDNEKDTIKICIDTVYETFSFDFEDKAHKKSNFFLFNKMAQEQSRIGVQFFQRD